MKIKLDENLPLSLAGKLRALGHEADTVADEGLLSGSDDVIWRAAQAEGRFLITQDLDFSDARRFVPHTTPASCSFGCARPGFVHWRSGCSGSSRPRMSASGRGASSWPRTSSSGFDKSRRPPPPKKITSAAAFACDL